MFSCTTNKFSLVIHVLFSQHKGGILKSIMKFYPVYKIVWIIGKVKIFSRVKVQLTPKLFFGRDETVQHSHKEFDNFISIWYFKGF